MEMKVYEESAKDVMYLKLVEVSNGIEVVVVNKEGNVMECGHLLLITKEGVTRYSCVNSDFGFSLDSRSKILDILE